MPKGLTAPIGATRGAALVRAPRVRIGAVVALAVAAGLAAWLLLANAGPSTRTSPSVVAVSQAILERLPAAVGHPVYWAGPQPGSTYELTTTADGRILIRYLPLGTRLGATGPFRTVGTYPLKSAVAAVRTVAKRSGGVTIALPGGGIAAQDMRRPTSVYLAYPGSDYEIELYDPSPTRALQLVRSGAVASLASGRSAAAHTVSAARLHALAASGRVLYWVGTKERTSYELTETSDGAVYLRYLPVGVRAGTGTPYLTVGTYPLAQPLAAIKTIAKRTGSKTFSIAGGGLAAVDASHATSVYAAFPGSNYEVEVYAPSASAAHDLVASGRLARVP